MGEVFGENIIVNRITDRWSNRIIKFRYTIVSMAFTIPVNKGLIVGPLDGPQLSVFPVIFKNVADYGIAILCNLADSILFV